MEVRGRMQAAHRHRSPARCPHSSAQQWGWRLPQSLPRPVSCPLEPRVFQDADPHAPHEGGRQPETGCGICGEALEGKEAAPGDEAARGGWVLTAGEAQAVGSCWEGARAREGP